MRVLCINTNGLLNDGITNSIINYYKHMDREDIEIDILKTGVCASGVEECISKLGIVIRFSAYRKNILKYIFSTATMIKKNKYDIVHVHGSSALLSLDLFAAWLGGCKVRIAHSRNTTCNHKVLDRLFRPLFYCLCTERFACGEDAGKWLFGNRSFYIINNGKNLDLFKFDYAKRIDVRKKYEWKNQVLIGHVGNFNYQKNHTFLIDLFFELQKTNPHYRLVLMGSGSEYFEKAKQQVRCLGIEDKVIFMGSISNVSEILQAMDIMLLPSRFEGLPNVVMEWQISGLPSFISDKITRECQVTQLVEFLPIDQGVDKWIERINSIETVEDRTAISEVACKKMKYAGYDIIENAQKLKEIYISVCDKG